MISSAKITPVIGALKVADMPAAAPQATRIRIYSSVTRNSRPTEDPSAAPICTIGPSRPADPPEPMQRAAQRNFMSDLNGAITLRSWATASMTVGTPSPVAPFARK